MKGKITKRIVNALRAARFLSEHVEAKRKSRTVAEYHRLLDKIILPALGTRKVADVTRHEIAKLHHARSATPYQANRVLAVLRKMFNLAERWGMRPDSSNPCRHLEKFREQVPIGADGKLVLRPCLNTVHQQT
ncbi:MAG TPA: hypothetical protein VKT70_08435, partial [Stellaceae bacterium]|nr:hypothetical protein [Stellaceae bacterium]